MGDVRRAVMVERGEVLRREAAGDPPVDLVVEPIGAFVKNRDLPVAGSVGAVISVGELSMLAGDELSPVLARVRTSLAPGGRLWFVDHAGRVQGVGGLVGSWIRSRALTGGFHLGRSLPERIRQAGFIITDIERFDMPTKNPLLRPWVQGVAIVESRTTESSS